MQSALEQYPRDRILNEDEVSWKILNHRMVTVAECGSEFVICEFDCNIKGCVTVMASIGASGGKLPLWVISRGMTIRCESKLRQNSLVKLRRINWFSRIKKTVGLIESSPADSWTDCRIS
jgi:hypothetical protein